MATRALVFLAEGFEEIEAVTSIDLLRRGNIEVISAGIGSQQVNGVHGITIQADCLLGKQEGDFDVIIIPGGMPGSTNIANSAEAVRLLKEQKKQGKLIAAICAAPAVVLGAHGFLTGLKATGYPSTRDNFTDSSYLDQPVVVDKNIITSQGPGTAALFALKIIEILAGEKTAADIHTGTIQQA